MESLESATRSNEFTPGIALGIAVRKGMSHWKGSMSWVLSSKSMTLMPNIDGVGTSRNRAGVLHQSHKMLENDLTFACTTRNTGFRACTVERLEGKVRSRKRWGAGEERIMESVATLIIKRSDLFVAPKNAMTHVSNLFLA